MPEVTIVMYHYVRELPLTRFPDIKGLKVSEFKNQLKYLKHTYELVTVQQCLDVIYEDGKENFPENAALLTFDDGYAEHFTTVFPILDRYQIQGAFFPPVQSILEHKVLDVNKIHFILASSNNPAKLVKEVNMFITNLKSEFSLYEPDYYMNLLSEEDHRYDPWEIVYLKRLLQRELPEQPKKIILDSLFESYVGIKEEIFARELYMGIEQLKTMLRHGMFIGGHGYSHRWLDALNHEEQENEVLQTKQLLKKIGVDSNKLVMCYPYGAFDENLLSILKKHNFKAGLTTEVAKANLDYDNRFKLERFDTNDFPK